MSHSSRSDQSSRRPQRFSAQPTPPRNSPSQIERIAPNKRLGQNFLRDANIARNIVRALKVEAGETALEIGPGEGALTAFLLETPARRVIAVEYDQRAVEALERRFADEIAAGRLRLLHRDALTLSGEEILEAAAKSGGGEEPPRIRIVGNIPYYITSDILFWTFQFWRETLEASGVSATPSALIMMQKEVAERITAKPRTKEYGILSVGAALASKPAVLFHVSPRCFFPPPKVTSSVVEFVFHAEKEAAERFRRVHPLVREAFGRRRKVLSNALSSSRLFPKDLTPTILEEAEKRKISYFRQRAEELTPEDFERLHDFLQEFQNFESARRATGAVASQ
jgi:16S rRNA (adenine1518-N6/adenine1519-N6)-dimethyltransferase